MRWSERADNKKKKKKKKKDKRKETKCVKRVGTAICAARTKNGQIHYNPVVLLDTKYSRTSLSRTRLFRITAYLEVKIWSLF